MCEVLAGLAERTPQPPPPASGRTAQEALGAFARAWVARLPLATDEHRAAGIGMVLMPEILADARTRLPFAQLMKLNAILLGLAPERLHRPEASAPRLVRVAEATSPPCTARANWPTPHPASPNPSTSSAPASG
ncbi:hypothetical protein [Streptomyces inhibens]|uniref:hypothetical protein n=1 Tax=Streptomyces inhibens TaxID=2293571 RepID=UPI001EE6E5F9|nr:hypothetical protein [Streptomyces inhibens]UKY51803.1 hypothetical protein KI385_25320 [Streptomyces inhibens]